MPISQPLIGYWKGFIVVFSLVGLNSAEYQFQIKLTYVNFEIGISKIHPDSDWIRPILRMYTHHNTAKTGTIIHHVDVGCQNIQREFTKSIPSYNSTSRKIYNI